MGEEILNTKWYDDDVEVRRPMGGYVDDVERYEWVDSVGGEVWVMGSGFSKLTTYGLLEINIGPYGRENWAL